MISFVVQSIRWLCVCVCVCVWRCLKTNYSIPTSFIRMKNEILWYRQSKREMMKGSGTNILLSSVITVLYIITLKLYHTYVCDFLCLCWSPTSHNIYYSIFLTHTYINVIVFMLKNVRDYHLYWYHTAN